MRETPNLRTIWLALANLSRLFRMNSGQGWTGEVNHLPNGSLLINYPRPLNAGFSSPDNKPVPGPGDLIGITPIVITEDMVGATVAVFTSLEIKRTDGGSTRAKQKQWINFVDDMGGIAGVFRSPDEAKELIKSYKGKRKLV